MKQILLFTPIFFALLFACNQAEVKKEENTQLTIPAPKQLSVEEVEELMKGQVTSGETRNGYINLGNEKQYFFDADSGVSIDFTLQTSSEFLKMEVYKKVNTKKRISATQLKDEKTFVAVSDSFHFADKPKAKTNYRVLIKVKPTAKDSSVLFDYVLNIKKI